MKNFTILAAAAVTVLVSASPALAYPGQSLFNNLANQYGNSGSYGYGNSLNGQGYQSGYGNSGYGGGLGSSLLNGLMGNGNAGTQPRGYYNDPQNYYPQSGLDNTSGYTNQNYGYQNQGDFYQNQNAEYNEQAREAQEKLNRQSRHFNYNGTGNINGNGYFNNTVQDHHHHQDKFGQQNFGHNSQGNWGHQDHQGRQGRYD